MIRINLLLHRAEKRKRRQIQFASLSIVSLLAGVLIVGFVHGVISARISYQESRNQFLKNEIAKLDKQIEEIKKLREQVKSLLARKEVVENLQSTRSDVVRLLDQMLRIIPDGIYLTSLKQTKNKVSVTGIAQSNARVASFMRAISNSPWLNSPVLIVVQAQGDASQTQNKNQGQFSLTFDISPISQANSLQNTPAANNKVGGKG